MRASSERDLFHFIWAGAHTSHTHNASSLSLLRAWRMRHHHQRKIDAALIIRRKARAHNARDGYYICKTGKEMLSSSFEWLDSYFEDARHRLFDNAQMMRAIMQIQRWARGRICRRHFIKLGATIIRVDWEVIKAATRLQKMWRGHRVRKRRRRSRSNSFRSKHGLPGHHGHGSHHHNHGRLHHPPHHGSGNHSPRGSTDHGGSSPTVTRRESKVSWTQGIHTGHTSPAGHPSPRSPHPPGSVLATANSSPLSPAVTRRGRTLSHDSL